MMSVKRLWPRWLLAMLGVVICYGMAGAADGVPVLTLQESIDIALKQSVIIHSAKEGVYGADAQKKEAFTGFLPKLSTSYNYTRYNTEPFFVFPGIPPLIPAGNLITGTINNYTWALEVRQPLFAGGGILANYQAGKAGSEIARFDETVTTLDLVQDVKIAYFNILKAERLLDVALQSVEQLKAHRDIAQNFFDVGLIPRNDLLRAEVELANGRQSLVKADNGVELAKSKFNTVLRRYINTPTKVEDILSYKPFVTPLDDCLKTALENRPEIKSTSMKVNQAQSMVRVAKSEFFPSVNAIGHYERYGDTPEVSGTPYKDRESWYVGVNANWNFWEWGRTKYRVDYRRSLENQSNDALQNVRDQVALDIKNAWLSAHEAEKQIQVSQKAIEQAEENFRISEERYKEQVGTSTDVMDAQTLLTRAKSDYFTALGDYNISLARLERAMGTRLP
jgi:outer membrane protein